MGLQHADRELLPQGAPKRRLANIAVATLVLLSVAALLWEPGAPRATSVPPSHLSMLPPVVAIVAAVLSRRAVLALALGVCTGALITRGAAPDGAFVTGTAVEVANAAMRATADLGHATILLFSMCLGAMMGVMQHSGSGEGLARWVTRFASNPRRGQLSAWAMGLLVFFDDYANSMLVGNAMRPVMDHLRVSREKLAFIVDATAAPVASLALVSSWIGVELGYIGDQLSALGIEGDAYGLFVASLQYRFYPWLMLFFVGYVAYSGWDFGPMYRAECRARQALRATPEGATTVTDSPAPIDATGGLALSLLPVASVLLSATLYMAVDGILATRASDNTVTLRAVFAAASSSEALLFASVVGALCAGALALRGGVLGARQLVGAYLEGMRTLLPACLILILAWMLSGYCRSLHTADVLVTVLNDDVSGKAVPAVVFLLGATVSFATGTSWGTMAILFPLALPLAHQLAPNDPAVFLGAISGILSGAVFGDHCSPISDTTVISSMAAGCDHVEHVRTQLPYALLVAAIALLVCELPVALGITPPWAALLLGCAAIALAVRVLSTVSTRKANVSWRPSAPP